MRTTLDLDDRVVRAAKALVAQNGGSIGTAVSDLALRGLSAGLTADASGAASPAAPKGFPVLPLGPVDHVITDDLVAELRDDA